MIVKSLLLCYLHNSFIPFPIYRGISINFHSLVNSFVLCSFSRAFRLRGICRIVFCAQWILCSFQLVLICCHTMLQDSVWLRSAFTGHGKSSQKAEHYLELEFFLRLWPYLWLCQVSASISLGLFLSLFISLSATFTWARSVRQTGSSAPPSSAASSFISLSSSLVLTAVTNDTIRLSR